MKRASAMLLFSILTLNSGISIMLVVLRIHYTANLWYLFLIWNLFLAWIPLLLSIAAYFQFRHVKKLDVFILVLGSLWLLFFPNAPYLVTDLIHLQPRHGVPLWYDTIMLLSFVWNGLMAGFFSLFLMQRIVTRVWGRLTGWFFVCSATLLSSLGVYIGRFLRWNSWDVFLEPKEVLSDILSRFISPWAHPRTWGLSLIFSAFFLMSYLLVWTLVHLEPERSDT